jgi:hypothetical protein
MESIDPIKQYLPTKGWLADYVKFTDGMEACTRFDFFSACCVLGAAINNKAWVQRGDANLLPKLFPNIWVILLAPPGRGHKTSVINMACNCLIAARSDVRLLADKLTPEYLIKSLSAPATNTKEVIRIGPRDATGLIRAPELSDYFGRENYKQGLVPLITNLYDYREKFSVGTMGRGSEFLYNNCISILGGSTPKWFQNMLPQDAFSGGFMSRFVLVEMPNTYVKRVAEPEAPTDITWPDLIKTLRDISQIEGELKWGNKGKQGWIEVYESSLPIGNDQLDAYREREAEQILKLAILIAISNYRDTIDYDDMMTAQRIIKELLKEVRPRIGQLTTHPNVQIVQELEDLLNLHGEMGDVEMLKHVYRSLSHGENQFKDALKLAIKVGKIQLIKVSKPGEPIEYKYKLKRDKYD